MPKDAHVTFFVRSPLPESVTPSHLKKLRTSYITDTQQMFIIYIKLNPNSNLEFDTNYSFTCFFEITFPGFCDHPGWACFESSSSQNKDIVLGLRCLDW